jgi:PmbA protein
MKNFIQNTIDQAMNLGADSCDVIINTGESINLSAQGGKLDKYKIAKTTILGLRVIKNKKIGLSYSESFDAEAIGFAVKSAIENSVYSGINEFENISIKNSNDFIQEKTKLVDKSTIEEKIDFALNLENEVKKRDSRVNTVPYNNLTISEAKSYYLNSLGTYTETGDGSLNAYTSALVKDSELTSMHFSSIYGKSLDVLDLNSCVDECLEHAINWLQAKPIASGKYDVIFNTEVLNDLLHSFGNYFSAKDAIEKTNPWEEKLGQSIASADFSLIDSPLYKDAFTHYYVDNEGMLKQDLTLIENGMLKSFYHNTATANYYKTNSTGHASRGARSSLNVAPTNWLIKPGKFSEKDVTDGIYLEVIDTMGLGGGDNISGEFSFGASGYLCKDGKRIQPVKEITVAGNFNKLLLGISRMGNELKHNSSFSMFSPLIRFSDLYIAGT